MNSNNELALILYALILMAMLSAECESVKINGFNISYTAILVHNCAPDNGDGTNGSVMIDMPLCETPNLIRTIHPAIWTIIFKFAAAQKKADSTKCYACLPYIRQFQASYNLAWHTRTVTWLLGQVITRELHQVGRNIDTKNLILVRVTNNPCLEVDQPVLKIRI